MGEHKESKIILSQAVDIMTNKKISDLNKIKFISFEGENMNLECPVGLLSKNQKYDVVFQTVNFKMDISFETLIKIEDVTPVEEDLCNISVRLTQYRKENWDHLTFLIAQQDKRIQSLFESIKGY